jgi:hypothetical protein
VLSDLLREGTTSGFLSKTSLVRRRNRLSGTLRRMHDVPFTSELIKAPIPGLIYIAGNGSLRCFAYKERPTDAGN